MNRIYLLHLDQLWSLYRSLAQPVVIRRLMMMKTRRLLVECSLKPVTRYNSKVLYCLHRTQYLHYISYLLHRSTENQLVTWSEPKKKRRQTKSPKTITDTRRVRNTIIRSKFRYLSIQFLLFCRKTKKALRWSRWYNYTSVPPTG